MQRLNAACPPFTEKIGRCLVPLLPELRLYQHCQAIDLFVHVRITASDVVILYASEIEQALAPSRTLQEARNRCLDETLQPYAQMKIYSEESWGDTVSIASFFGSTQMIPPLLFYVSKRASSRMTFI